MFLNTVMENYCQAGKHCEYEWEEEDGEVHTFCQCEVIDMNSKPSAVEVIDMKPKPSLVEVVDMSCYTHTMVKYVFFNQLM
jgi:hypothetical protein